MKILCSSQMGAATIMGQTMRVVAVAKALKRRGHDIKYLAGPELEPVIRNHGLDVLSLPPLPKLDLFQNQPGEESEEHWREKLSAFKESFQRIFGAEMDAVGEYRPDGLLSGAFTSIFIAMKSGIPCLMTFLQPHGNKTLEHFQRRLPQNVDRQKILAEFLKAIDLENIDLRSLLFLETIEKSIPLIFLEGMPEISGDLDPESLTDKMAGFKPKIRFTGPLMAEEPDNLPGQEDLKLKHTGIQNKPLIYVTIGGGSSLIGTEFLNLVMEMFRQLPEFQGLVATGLGYDPEQINPDQRPANVIIRGFVPGVELVKASDIVIFHGGSSSLMTCIACGKPAVVIPSIGEQEDNGAVLSQQHAGLVLTKENLTPFILVEAVRHIMADSTFRIHAEKLQTLGRKYGGADGAAEMAEAAVQERRLAGAGAHIGGR